MLDTVTLHDLLVRRKQGCECKFCQTFWVNGTRTLLGAGRCREDTKRCSCSRPRHRDLEWRQAAAQHIAISATR